MPKYLNQIKALKKINKSTIISNKFLIDKEKNIKIYYAPFDYVNPKAKIMIVGITPGLHHMLQIFEVIHQGKSLQEVNDQSSFKGSMRTSLVKYLDELEVNKKNSDLHEAQLNTKLLKPFGIIKNYSLSELNQFTGFSKFSVILKFFFVFCKKFIFFQIELIFCFFRNF